MRSFLRRVVLSEKPKAVVLTLAFGAAGGLAAVVFQLLMNGLYRAAFTASSETRFAHFAVISLFVITATSLAVGLLLHFVYPKAAGSGIPEVKTAFWNDMGFIPFRAVLTKMVAGVLSLGGGTSLGREGPSVFISVGCASTLAGSLGAPKRGRRGAAAAGAAAGLAAAFNTPLAAITFVLEEVVGDLNSRLLGSVVLASVVGAFAVQAIVGDQPAFIVPVAAASSWTVYALTPLVALLAAALGVVFQSQTLNLRARLRNVRFIPGWLRPVLGGWLTWFLGCAVFFETGRLGVFGLGYGDLSDALQHGLPWRLAALLAAAKLAATIVSYGMGGCGGIFSPTLFLGGMCGFVLGGLAQPWLPLTHGDLVILASVGMSACFGAVVRAPMTSILIVFEMTHEFSLVPALLIGLIVSQSVSRMLCRHNFYEAALLQDGHHMHRIKPPRDLGSWQSQPISTIANHRPVVLTSLDARAISSVLKSHPYDLFPVELEGRFAGVARRRNLERAAAEHAGPALDTAAVCSGSQSVREASNLMIQHPGSMAILLDDETGRVSAIVTLHDLLRAQLAVME